MFAKFKESVNNWKVFSSTVVLFLFATLIVDMFRLLTVYIFNDLYPVTNVIRNVIYVLLMAYFYIHMLLNYKTKRIFVVAILGAAYLAVVAISFSLNDSIAPLAKEGIIMLVGRLLPGLYIGMMIVGEGANIKMIGARYVSTVYLALILILLSFFQPMDSAMSIAKSYMSISHNLMFASFFFLYASFFEHRKLSLIFYFINLIYIFLLGSRGALLYLLIPSFLLVVVYLYHTNRRLLRWFLGMLGVVLLTLSVFSSHIIALLGQMFPDSRTILILKDLNFFGIDSRLDHLLPSIHAVGAAPFRFRGLFADSVLTARHLEVPLSGGLYAHNLFVELLVDYGVVFGGLVILLIAYITVKAISRIIRVNKFYLYFVFLTFAIYPLIESMVSGSFTISYQLWIGIGGLLELCIGSSLSGESAGFIDNKDILYTKCVEGL